jgi:DNA transformation protein and related proteins
MDHAKQISDLRSLGPKSQEMLARAGIRTLAQLRELGSVEAYVRARRANFSGVSLNLLWALESALTGEPWQQVAQRCRASLLLAVEEREKNAGRFATGDGEDGLDSFEAWACVVPPITRAADLRVRFRPPCVADSLSGGTI